MTTWMVLGALVWSAVFLTLVARHDPKRLRWRQKQARTGLAQKSSASAWEGPRRSFVIALTFMPALLMVALGAWAAMLMWLGLVFSYGWLLTEVMAQK